MAADKEFSWPPMRINLSVYKDFAVTADRLDPRQHWGGLTPAIRPEDNAIVYLCDTHLRDLDYPYYRTTTPPKSQ